MKKFITNKETHIIKGLYSAIPDNKITIPKGTPVNYSKECGCFFVNPSIFPVNSIDWHDAIYYGYRVDKENVVEIND
jgi:hypothetical protein